MTERKSYVVVDSPIGDLRLTARAGALTGIWMLDPGDPRSPGDEWVHEEEPFVRAAEQLAAYFNGDPIHAMKKGIMILDRVQVSHMAQLQNMLDFPPAPDLDYATQSKLCNWSAREECRT